MRYFVKRKTDGTPVTAAKSPTAEYPALEETTESDFRDARAELVAQN